MKAQPANIGGIEIYKPSTVLGKAMGTLKSGTGTIEDPPRRPGNHCTVPCLINPGTPGKGGVERNSIDSTPSFSG